MARHHASAVALYDAAIARFGGRGAAPVEILFNRANSLADGGGRDADAIAGFDEYLAKGAVEGLSSADVAAATFFRGIVERRAGRRDAAAASFEAAAPALASADDAAVARRLLATLQRAGAADGTDGADDVAYSRWLFDGYAESFDDELRRLGYAQIPRRSPTPSSTRPARPRGRASRAPRTSARAPMPSRRAARSRAWTVVGVSFRARRTSEPKIQKFKNIYSKRGLSIVRALHIKNPGPVRRDESRPHQEYLR